MINKLIEVYVSWLEISITIYIHDRVNHLLKHRRSNFENNVNDIRE